MKSKSAYSYLIKILSARDYSEHKLREKLREKKFPSEEIEESINEIKSRGFLREEAYAEARVKAFMHKGYSVSYIQQKLGQEHLKMSEEEIHHIFRDHRVDESQQIERLARKKISHRSALDFEEQGKILRYLISKGHDFSLAKKIVRSLASGADETSFMSD